jgi:NADPH-dependent 2,4-dienoyl-CoA reductase/sulfur reductase-like enzyme
MRTQAPGVLAAGDVAHAHNPIAERRLAVEHWGEADAMGEVAGTVAAGREAAWATAPGFWSTIGGRTLKFVAWGDGYDEARLVEEGDGAFAVWYGRDGELVGVLAHNIDAAYERGRELIETRQSFSRSWLEARFTAGG